MVSNQKFTGKATSMAGGVLKGALASLIWTFLASGLLAWLIHREYLPQNAVGYGRMVILLTASALGAAYAFGRVKRQRIAVSAYTSGVYFLMLLGMTALFFGGQYTGMGVTLLMVLAGTGSVLLLGGRGGRHNRTVRKYKP